MLNPEVAEVKKQPWCPGRSLRHLPIHLGLEILTNPVRNERDRAVLSYVPFQPFKHVRTYRRQSLRRPQSPALPAVQKSCQTRSPEDSELQSSLNDEVFDSDEARYFLTDVKKASCEALRQHRYGSDDNIRASAWIAAVTQQTPKKTEIR